MTTTKKTALKKKLLDDNQIISFYMDSVLEKNNSPMNVYLFCKENAIEEADFYAFFSSFDAVKQAIWVKFFKNTVSAIEKEKSYPDYTNTNKLLALYFTLFEILTLNRSYVLYSMKDNGQGMKNLKDLKSFRNHFKTFIVHLIQSDPSGLDGKVAKVTEPVFSEGAWLQFLFLLKFWMEDTSKGFEKTDILIEKSVNTVVDLLDTKPLEKVIDLAKFLWKERP